MKKHIYNLISKIFKDVYDDDEFSTDNITKEIADDLTAYQVGDIYYENKKPIAICCGSAQYFEDKTPRFLLLTESIDKFPWSSQYNTVKELSYNYKIFNRLSISNYNKNHHIDDNGYNNTQIIINNYDIILTQNQ